MESEEEESSTVNKPSPILEYNATTTMPHAQDEVFHSEPHYEPFTAPESLEPQLVGGGKSPSPPPATADVDGDVIDAEESKVVEEDKDVQTEENKEVSDDQAVENMEVNDDDRAEENKELSGVQTEETKDVADVPEEEKVVADLSEEKEVVADVSGELASAEEEVTAAEAEEGMAVVADVGGNMAATDVVEDTVAAEEKEKGSEEAEVADLADKAVEIEVADEAVGREVGDAGGQSGEEERDVVQSAEENTEVVTEKGDVTDIVEENEKPEDREVVDEAVADLGKEPDVSNVTEKPELDEEALTNIAGETDLAGQVEEMEVADETAEGPDTETEVEGKGEGEDGDDSGMADEAMETETAEEADVMEETTEAEETEAADEAEGMEVVSRVGSGGGKRKRGRNLKAPVRAPSRKKGEEDVCFICFDGGELVLCDRRGCPKAYHPSCVNRDEAFFRAKGRWNCGWHLCSNCEKNAYYMCYTCTFSLCKGCIKDAVIFCVRENKGFCETCMKTVMLIEKNEQGNKDMDQIDFDDKSSWEYLFKDYWIDLKERLSLTLNDLVEAKNPWKGSDPHAYKQESPDEPFDANNDGGSGSDGSMGNFEPSNSKRRKAKKRLKSRGRGKDSRSTITATVAEGPSVDDSGGWASKELLEFVMHMRNGDKSVVSQFDVQALLLEYIKRNKLRDPRRKSQIICDSRLENLFGKPRVGHFEMLKLLESHFLIKEDSQVDDLQGSVVDTEASNLEVDGNSDALSRAGKDKRRKMRKKGDEKGRQSNLDDYAAIDNHNINLIYLRRNLVEDLLEDTENFHDKVVGSFARIRISGSSQKQDLYRLVQVVGTCKASEPYKVGKRMTDTLLEILNLNKTEIISIDIISNQEFTEDECKRLRQSIKCGLINRLTVGDIQEKAMALQAVRVKDWLETEIVRLSHLRDRAKKLQLLKAPEERQRRLEEIPEIHADPNMDPSYESEEEEEETDDKKQESFLRPRGSGFGRRGREPISPRKGGPVSSDPWSGTRNYSNMGRELSRNFSSRGFSNKVEDTAGTGEIVNDSWNHGRETELQQTSSWDKHKVSSSETVSRSTQSVVISESFPTVVSETLGTPLSTGAAQSAEKFNEAEKIWHYKDPSGKVQGPFSITQLRKWSTTGYFPAELRIWKATEKQEDSILLTDALVGKFQKDPSSLDGGFSKAQIVHNSLPSPSSSAKPEGAVLQRGTEVQVGGESWRMQTETNSSTGKVAPTSVEVPRYSVDGWGSTNLPSPTPSQTPMGSTKVQTFENKWSANTVQAASSLLGGSGGPQPSVVVPQETVTPAPKPDKIIPTGSMNAIQMPSLPTMSAPVLNDASINHGADLKNVVSNLQSLVQSVTGYNPPVEKQGWGSGSVPKPEMITSGSIPGSESQPWVVAHAQKVESSNPTIMPAQPPAHGHWSDGPSVQAPSPMYNGGNFPSTGFSSVPPSDPWRPAVSSNQSNIHPPAPSPWGMGTADNQTAVPNQNTGWGPKAANPNMGWGGPVWGASGQGPAIGNANPGWVAHGQGLQASNPISGWGPPGQGQPPMNANQGWGAPGQGPPPGNPNPGWGAPTGNQGKWGSERNHNADRYSNQRDRGSHGGDSGYGGGNKPWNRQSSFGNGGGGGGGGSSRPPFKGQRVCKYHESGHCKKGASCDYMHT
ncbi:hypothetical protein FEM48_Zijuj09G0096900 [Ziziphus jujuba var. spinosa]|uniref:Zinc finger CCCH domain-containing protein 19 n=1 Tax=Ziziphus jujuba var. spinosa TaxID=714518 RepID=A0A978US95_ZIZJJ|nr:hypothetical protein FEM48_Zijuj09G0096900 [Ziziphus jujuba var. spinosa]